jgi:hypothetical protein
MTAMVHEDDDVLLFVSGGWHLQDYFSHGTAAQYGFHRGTVL